MNIVPIAQLRIPAETNSRRASVERVLQYFAAIGNKKRRSQTPWSQFRRCRMIHPAHVGDVAPRLPFLLIPVRRECRNVATMNCPC